MAEEKLPFFDNSNDSSNENFGLDLEANRGRRPRVPAPLPTTTTPTPDGQQITLAPITGRAERLDRQRRAAQQQAQQQAQRQAQQQQAQDQASAAIASILQPANSPLPTRPLFGGRRPGDVLTEKSLRYQQQVRERPELFSAEGGGFIGGSEALPPSAAEVSRESTARILRLPTGTPTDAPAPLRPEFAPVGPPRPTAPEPFNATLRPAAPPPLRQRIQETVAEVPVYGSLIRGIREGEATITRQLSGFSSLVGDAVSAGSSYLGLGDFSLGFKPLATLLSRASEEELRQIETEYAEPDIRSREFPELQAPIETVSRVAGQAIPNVAFQALTTKGLGTLGLPLRLRTPAVFGAQKMFEARSQGITDPDELLKRALTGAGEGFLFDRANSMKFGPGRLTTQALVGGGQEVLESGLENRPLTAQNVFRSALTNVALDLVGPGSGLGDLTPQRLADVRTNLPAPRLAEIEARPTAITEALITPEAVQQGGPLFDVGAFRAFQAEQRSRRFVAPLEPGRPAPSMDTVRFYPGTGGKPGSLFITAERMKQLGPAIIPGFTEQQAVKAGLNIPVAQLEAAIPKMALTPAESRYLTSAVQQARSVGSKRVGLTTTVPGIGPGRLGKITRHESIHSAQPNRPRYSKGVAPPPEIAAQFEVLPEVMDAVAQRYDSEIPEDSPLSGILAKVAASNTYKQYKGQPLGRFLAIEAPAYIGSGDSARLGLTPREGAILFSDYLESITEKGGFGALSQFAEIARLSPRLQPLLEAVLTNTIAKGRVSAGLPLYGGFGPLFDPSAWGQFLGRKKAIAEKDPTGETSAAKQRQTLNLADLESRADKSGRLLALTPERRQQLSTELSDLKSRLATLDPRSPEFSSLSSRYVDLSRAIEDSSGAESITDTKSLYQHLLTLNAGDQTTVENLWRDLGLPEREAQDFWLRNIDQRLADVRDMGAFEERPPSRPRDSDPSVLSANPFLDPQQYRRFFKLFRDEAEGSNDYALNRRLELEVRNLTRAPGGYDLSHVDPASSSLINSLSELEQLRARAEEIGARIDSETNPEIRRQLIAEEDELHSRILPLTALRPTTPELQEALSALKASRTEGQVLHPDDTRPFLEENREIEDVFSPAQEVDEELSVIKALRSGSLSLDQARQQGFLSKYPGIERYSNKGTTLSANPIFDPQQWRKFLKSPGALNISKDLGIPTKMSLEEAGELSSRDLAKHTLITGASLSQDVGALTSTPITISARDLIPTMENLNKQRLLSVTKELGAAEIRFDPNTTAVSDEGNDNIQVYELPSQPGKYVAIEGNHRSTILRATRPDTTLTAQLLDVADPGVLDFEESQLLRGRPELRQPLGEASPPTMLASNPFFDPQQWKRLLPFLRRREAARAESDATADELTAEQTSLRTPEQQTTANIAEVSTKLEQEQLQNTARIYEAAKAERKAARDKLRALQILKQNPDYLNPAKQAALDAEIAKAQAAYDAAAEPARQEFQRFKDSRETLRQAEEERIRLRAQQRLADGDTTHRLDPDIPYLDEIQNLPVSKSFLKVAKDVVEADGTPLSNDELVVDQVIEMGLAGRIPLQRLLPLLEKNGIELDQFFTDLRAGVRRGATLMSYLSHIRRSQDYLNQISEVNPKLAAVLQMKLPSMKDLSPYLRERTNLQRLTSILQGLLTSMFRTAMNNFTMAGARVGLDSVGQLFDSAAQNMGLGRGAGVKTPLSPALALRPFLMMLSEGFSQPPTAARKAVRRYRGQDPSTIPDTRATRFFKAIEAVYPRETFPVGEIAVGADITRGDAGLALLRSYRDQALAYPKGGARREKILSSLDKAEKALRNEQRFITKTLMGAEGLVSKLTWANLAQEKIARRAIFEAKLRRFATEAGIDVDGAITDGTLASKLPVDLVTKAADEALRLTYGTRRIKDGMFGGVGDAALKLGGVPFPNFIVNFMIDQVESSPLGLLRYLSAREREKVAGGDLRGLWQPLFGLAIFGMAAQQRAAYYNSLSPTPESTEDSRAMAAAKILGTPGAALAPKAGPRWYELQLGSRTLDLRPTPWGAAYYLADYFERQKRGLADPAGLNKEEVMKTVLGLNLSAPELASDAIINTVKALTEESEFTADRASTLAGRYVGGQLAGFLTPLRQLSDLAAPFSPGEAVRRETVPPGGGFLPTVTATLQSRIPFFSQSLPEYESPTKAAAPERQIPLTAQLSGLSFPEAPTALEKELSDLGIPPAATSVSTGIPDVDRTFRAKMGELMSTHLEPFLTNNESFRGQAPTRRAIALADEILPDLRAAAAEFALSQFPDAYRRQEILKALTPRERQELNLRRKLQGLPPIEESLGK